MENAGFGKMVRKALIDQEIKQVELATKLSMNPRYLSHILTGRRSPGKYEQPIRSALGLDKNQSRIARPKKHWEKHRQQI